MEISCTTTLLRDRLLTASRRYMGKDLNPIEHQSLEWKSLHPKIFYDESNEYCRELKVFINFMAYSGNKNEPKLDGYGKPSSRRPTPVHQFSQKVARKNFL
ncbi:unnamed protein product [Trichogramma brassicae]|uniref:Uncharacterized protein n=1 Tax=Trichogramma brassicae TaxID=86971 RepID=A0A6H5J0G5_9HYME|nr:unnamed protein product [Trichogramma brassicae]